MGLGCLGALPAPPSRSTCPGCFTSAPDGVDGSGSGFAARAWFFLLPFFAFAGALPPCTSVWCSGDSGSALSEVLLAVDRGGCASLELGWEAPGWSCVVGWPPCWARASSRASKVMSLPPADVPPRESWWLDKKPTSRSTLLCGGTPCSHGVPLASPTRYRFFFLGPGSLGGGGTYRCGLGGGGRSAGGVSIGSFPSGGVEAAGGTGGEPAAGVGRCLTRGGADAFGGDGTL